MRIEKTTTKKEYNIDKISYIAYDGTSFTNEKECWLYEKYNDLEKEGRVKLVDYTWFLFNNQKELDEYSNKIRAYACNIENKHGKFPVWVRFKWCYNNDQYEEYLTIPLLESDYKDICELKKMIEETQLKMV